MNTTVSWWQTLKRLLSYALAYVLWAATALVCVVAVLQLRSAVNVLWPALGGGRYALWLISQIIVLAGGLAAFIYTVFLEGYYRESITRLAPRDDGSYEPRHAPGAQPGRRARWLAGAGVPLLLRRFVLATALPLAILAVSFVLLEIGLRAAP